jgi:hypothetical protein
MYKHNTVVHIHLIILLSVACLDVAYFPTLSHKQHYFRGGGGGSYLT